MLSSAHQLFILELVVSLMLPGGTKGGQVSGRFHKVVGNFVENNCFLATAAPGSTALGLRTTCSLACLQTVNCRFFCSLKSTGTCALFKAFVAVRWQGDPVSTTGTKYDACYTSWGDPRDIVKTNSPFDSSTLLAGFSTKPATDGYACAPPAYFATQNLSNSYSQIDLEQTTRVRTVIAATAYYNHISDMDVILSNTSDFTLGKKLGRVYGGTPAWSTYTFNPNTNVAGRYITFFQAKANYHGYADIQIIPTP